MTGAAHDAERLALRLAIGAARGRLADIHAAEEALAELRSSARYAADNTADELDLLVATTSLIWSVLVAGTIDVLDGDPPADRAELVAALRSVAPRHLEDALRGQLDASKRLWEAAGYDTSGWEPWPDVEPDPAPRSVADLDLPALVGMHVEVDVADHPDAGYIGRMVAARDDLLVLAWTRPEYGGVTLVPTSRLLAVRVLDDLLPWRMQEELEEFDR